MSELILPNFEQYVSKDTKEENFVKLQITTSDQLSMEFERIKCAPEKEIELKNFVTRNIRILLDYAVNNGDRKIINIIIDPLFINFVTQHFGNLLVLTDDMIQKMNRIYYDYVRSGINNPDVLSAFCEFVNVTNSKIMLVLAGFNLTKEQSSLLVAARYSTAVDTRMRFKRVIRTVQSMPSNLMTEQNIINIFGKLCPSPVTDLFIAMMLDNYTGYKSSDEEYVYSTVSLAVLDILESLPLKDIQKVLTSYSIALANTNKRPRFMMRSISVGDYPRINEIIDILESQGIHVF